MEKEISLLMVEEKKSCSQIIEKLFENEKKSTYALTSLNSISDLASCLNDSKVDALLLDIEYKTVVKELDAIKNTAKDVPIVAITTSENESDALHVIQDGVHDYLVKDKIDAQNFDHTIHSAIERHNSYKKLRKNSYEFQQKEAKLLNVIVNNADGIIVVDNNKKIRFTNPAAERMLSHSASELMGLKFKYAIDISKTYEIEISETMVVEINTVRTEWDEENAFLISMRDITERKAAEKKLRESEERYALAIKGSNDGVWDWNLVEEVIYYSPGWKSIVGYPDEDIGNSPNEWFDKVHPDDLPKISMQIEEHLKNNISSIKIEHRLRHKDGGYRWFVARGTAISNEENIPVRLIGSLRDISEFKEAEAGMKDALEELKFALASEKVLLEELDRKNKDLVELSITDGLTGLFNHRFIQERFDFEFKRAKRYGTNLSCMMIDIDHFKKINDTYGHQFGDFVLREISSIVVQNSREVDLCGRYGGEEFLIISTQDADGARKYAEKLHKAIEGNIFQKGKQAVHITVSIGISDYKAELKSKQEMIERADRALYQAKEDGRNLIRVWKESEKSEVAPLDVSGIETLQSKLHSLSSEVRATYMESTNALLKAVDSKDKYTLTHSTNVSNYCVDIAHAMGVDEEQVEVIRYAGLLHDIGKIGIDKSILTKNGPLTSEEFEVLKKHPMIGVSILKDIKFLERELPIIQHHHEWYNGGGYPQGLKGREIPFGALILAVADAYDAMNTDRQFRQKLTKDDIIKELKFGSGIQFAPEVVNAFVKLLKKQ